MTGGGSRLLAEEPVHAQALKLSRDGWRVVLSLPLVCDEIGESCPEWAWKLCEHVASVTDGSPVTLVHALGELVDADGGVLRSSKLVALGSSLDLWEVVELIDVEQTRVRLTTFGATVAMLHVRSLVGPLEGDDEP